MQVEWFEHPKYVVTRERLISTLTSRHYRFRRTGPVVFLCGKYQSSARDRLSGYLRRHIPEIQLFYAEHVWDVIAERQPLGALAMEADLAARSDLVIVIVESAGTCAELGAFSNSPELRPKLLAIIDVEFRPPQSQPSFIALGPIKWIEADSLFAPTIYTKLTQILAAAPEIEERIQRIKPSSHKVSDLAGDPKHLFLFISDLITIAFPLTMEAVQAYCERILRTPPDSLAVATSVAIAKAVGILASAEIKDRIYYFPRDPEATGRSFHHLHLATLPGLRAEHLAALQAIPAAREIMKEIWRHSAN